MAEEIIGLSALQEKFRQLSAVAQQQGATRGGKAGAKVILESMEAKVSVKTGRGREGLMMKNESTGAQIRFLIGPDKKQAWRLRFIEFGVRPHDIVVTGRRLRSGRTQARFLFNKFTGEGFGSRTHHPGLSGKFFMRRSLDEDGPRAVETMGAELWKLISEQGNAA